MRLVGTLPLLALLLIPACGPTMQEQLQACGWNQMCQSYVYQKDLNRRQQGIQMMGVGAGVFTDSRRNNYNSGNGYGSGTRTCTSLGQGVTSCF